MKPQHVLPILFCLLTLPVWASGPGELRFQDRGFDVQEEAGVAVVRVERTGGDDGVVSVDVYASGTTAAEGLDFAAVVATLTWAADDRSDRTLTVPILDDGVAEGAEEIVLVMSNPTGGAALDPERSIAVLTIRPSDGAENDEHDDSESDSESDSEADSESDGESDSASDEADSESDNEEDSESDNEEDSESDSEDSDAESDGEDSDSESDGEDSDSESDNEEDSESDGEDSDSEDSDAESDGEDSDDQPGGDAGVLKFDETSFEVLEQAGVAVITVERSKGETGAVSVDYATFDGTAVDGVDYTGVAGTLTWAAGDGGNQTFIIPVFDDDEAEGTEHLDLVLTGATGGATIDPQRGNATVRLIDDDATACASNSDAMCLSSGRFRVEVDWRTPQNAAGPGRPIMLSDRSGLFWFFDRTNIEMLVKIIDACDGFGAHWVFFSATTNVELDVTVTDTLTGQTKVYRNPLGNAAEPIQDTETFTTCP